MDPNNRTHRRWEFRCIGHIAPPDENRENWKSGGSPKERPFDFQADIVLRIRESIRLPVRSYHGHERGGVIEDPVDRGAVNISGPDPTEIDKRGTGTMGGIDRVTKGERNLRHISSPIAHEHIRIHSRPPRPSRPI